MSAVVAVPLLAALVVLALGTAASGHLLPVRRQIPGARGRPRAATVGWLRGGWRRPTGGPVAWFTTRMRPTDRPPGDAELAAWCERVARALRSGDSLRTAVHAAPVGTDRALAQVLAPIHLALDRGATVAHAIATTSVTTAGLAMVRSVLTATAELGGSGAEALDRTATVLRQRHADAAERRVHAAQARLSAIVLTVLPVGTGALLLTLDPEIRAASTAPIGLGVIALGVTLDGLGWWWMRRIVGGGP